MATQYSNKPIVTNGLVYALDFGNPKSYVSGSTSASSLIFPPNATTVTAGMGYNNGLLLLTQSANVSATSLTTINILNSFTVSTVARINNNGINYLFYNQLGGYPNTVFKATTTDVGILFGGKLNNIGRSYASNNTRLQHLTWRYNTGSYDFFINGIPQPPTGFSGVAAYNDGGFKINGQYGDLSGSIGNVFVYNRALTSDEIWQNYQISAQRYSLATASIKPYSLDENAYLYISSSKITDPTITTSINTFVVGMKNAGLWNKMKVIYPFLGSTTTTQSINLKEPGIYALTYANAWSGSSSGSAPFSTSSYISSIVPSDDYASFSTQSAHLTVLSYDLPTTSSFLAGTTGTITTSSFAIFQTETATTGAINNEIQTGITGSGNIGLITVSRTGSNVLTLHKNTNSGSFSVPASSSLATSIYLDAVNINNTASSFSPYNISYASVGAGLTTSEVATYHNLVGQLQTNLKRKNTLLDNYTGAAAAYSLRRIGPSGYFGPAIRVRRDSDNTLRDIGFTSDGQLDTVALLDFVGVTGSGFVNTWYDQSGNSRNFIQTTTTNQPYVILSGSINTDSNKPSIYFDGGTGATRYAFMDGPNNGPFVNTPISAFNYIRFREFSSGAQNAYYLGTTGVNGPFIGFGRLSAGSGWFLSSWNSPERDGGIIYGVNPGTTPNLLTGFYTSPGNIVYKNSNLIGQNTTYPATNVVPEANTTLRLNAWWGGASTATPANHLEMILYASDKRDVRVPIDSNILSYYVTGSDTDYQAFITATGITQPTQSAALETLVSDLKSYGLWNKMKAIYPMITDKYNLYSNTENLSTGWLTVSSSLTASNAAGPFTSSLVANRLVEGSGTVTPAVYQTVTLVSGSSYVMSTHARWNGRDYLVLNPDANSATWFDIKNGYVSSSIGTAFSSSIQRVSGSAANPSGSWYRCSMMFNAVVSTAQNTSIQLSDADGVLTYTGGGASGSYLWGTQFENGTFLSPYLSNTTNVAYTTASMLDQMKYNLKNPANTNAAYRLTFTGTWQPGYTGNKPAGNGYADTYLNPVATLSTASAHFYLTLRTSIIENGTEMGNDDSAFIVGGFSTQGLLDMPTTTDRISLSITPTTDNKGNYLVMLNSDSRKVLRNQINEGQAGPATTNFGPSTIKIASGKYANSTKESAFATIGDGLTDYEAKALYWIVQKYQTTLGRQVY